MNCPDIIDPDDFCRACMGKGGAYERTERGTRIFENCYLCRGTGARTVRLGLDEQREEQP